MKKIHQTAKTLVQGHQSQNMQINRYLKEKAENHLINGLWKIFLAVCWCNQSLKSQTVYPLVHCACKTYKGTINPE